MLCVDVATYSLLILLIPIIKAILCKEHEMKLATVCFDVGMDFYLDFLFMLVFQKATKLQMGSVFLLLQILVSIRAIPK